MNQKIGEVYFIKDGQVTTDDLTVNNEYLQEIMELLPRYKWDGFPIKSLEERSKNITNFDDIISNPLDEYESYVKNGYSIIRVIKKVSYFDELILIEQNSVLTCLVANNISSSDADTIKKTYSKVENEMKNDILAEIFIHYNYDYGNSFDYYTNIEKNYLVPVVLDCHLRNKTNNLTEEERQMFENYKDFDLEKLLTLSACEENSIINNNNNGVMIIGENKIYESTCKSFFHIAEFTSIYKNINTKVLDNKYRIPQMCYVTSDILIQLFFGKLVVWLPATLNDYQIQNMLQLIHRIKSLNLPNNELISAGVVYGLERKDVVDLSGEGISLEEYLLTYKNPSEITKK